MERDTIVEASEKLISVPQGHNPSAENESFEGSEHDVLFTLNRISDIEDSQPFTFLVLSMSSGNKEDQFKLLCDFHAALGGPYRITKDTAGNSIAIWQQPAEAAI